MVNFWKEICSQVSKVLNFDKVILLLGLCPKEIIRKTVLIDRDIIMMEKLETVYKSTIWKWLNKLWYIHMMDTEML